MRKWWPAIIASLIYLVLSLRLAGWLIDDAGISFAYARSLGHLDGLVSQPGMNPVEGFSNPLWVFILAPFFTVGLFHPYLTPKLLALALVLITNLNIQRSLEGGKSGSRLISVTSLLLLNTSAPFLIWASSGLENALYAAGLAWQFRLAVEFDATSATTRKAMVLVAASLVVAFTRPDGVLFLPLPIVAVLAANAGTRSSLLNSLRPTLLYLVSVSAGYASFLIFRFLYFGRWTPNTYAAKGGRMLDTLWAALTPQEPYIVKMQQLFQSIWGTKLWLVFPMILAVALGFMIGCGRQTRRVILTFLWSAAGYAVYMLLPSDWMPEYRFATPFLVFIYALIPLLLIGPLLSGRTRNKVSEYAALGVAIILLAISVKINLPRYWSFSGGPPVAFETVASRYADDFNAYAQALGVKDGSILLPDVGGTLYYSDLKVYDMVGLTDSTIARTLKNHKDEFYDYVFEDIRPSFIHFHGNWNLASRLYDDPRFYRDYIAITDYDDKYAERGLGRSVKSGDYVRREIVQGISEWRRKALNAAEAAKGQR